MFPGSNCDHDCYHVIRHVLGQEVDFIWHKTDKIGQYDCIILPGGFSYGDYLRPGAIAHFSPVMKQIKAYAEAGGLLLGICNGFQILLETGLLPGAMRDNAQLKFICDYVYISIANNNTPFTKQCSNNQVLRIPIAHMQGNYYADERTLAAMRDNGQIIFQYCDASGNINDDVNPNGSVGNIAGICNKQGNVLGMMPHPERCVEDIWGSADGRFIFDSIIRP